MRRLHPGWLRCSSRSIDKSETVGRVIVTTSLATVLTEADPQEWARRPVLYEDRYPNETHPD